MYFRRRGRRFAMRSCYEVVREKIGKAETTMKFARGGLKDPVVNTPSTVNKRGV